MFPMISRRVISLYKGEIIDIGRLLLKRHFIKGSCVDIFEKDFAQYVGAKYAVAVGSGRLALYAILQVLNLPKDSEVLLAAYEDMSVPEAICQAGLRPVFVDIDAKTQNIDLIKLKKKLSDKTSAIVAAHIFGNAVDVAQIKTILGERKIVIVEDCAHALGTTCSGKHVGNTGNVAFFSFNTTKPFSCFGGGMIITGDEKIYAALRSHLDRLAYPKHFAILRRIFSAYLLSFLTSPLIFSWAVLPCLRFLNYIQIEALAIYQKFFKRSGNTIEFLKFSNVQAFIGMKNLKNFGRLLEKRKRNARELDRLLKKGIRRPLLSQGCNYYFFNLFSSKRDAFRQRILREGLDSGKLLMRNCASLLKVNELFPNTDMARNESVQIPIYERLPPKRIEEIARIINKHYIS